MSQIDGGPAFPSQNPHDFCSGMSLRDWFAGQALMGLCESAVCADYTTEHVAEVCYRFADAMIDERRKLALTRIPE